MDSALLGILGVIIGIVANEWIRRRNRIESYAQKTFEKRLEIYEVLFQLVNAGGAAGTKAIKDSSLCFEDRFDLVNGAIVDIVQWCDEHSLYLDEEVTIQCVTLLMGVEDVQDMVDEAEKGEKIESFYLQLRYTKDMLKKASGIQDVNSSFTLMTKAKFRSPVLDYYNQQKKAMRKANKKKTA
ncbi:hypothetical protein ACK3BK_04660 [Pseudomonas sp. L7]|uniref:hypothetical protein n=1 Tax=Pseudomonas sp. L7 TaxID=3388343 RepID=UPI003984D4BF